MYMPTKNLKPIYVMNMPGFPSTEKKAVLEGLNLLMNSAQVDLEIIDFANWRSEDCLNPDGTLSEFKSVEWYVEKSDRIDNSSRRRSDLIETRLNASTVLSLLEVEPCRKPEVGGKDHYDVFLTERSMYSGSKNNNFVIGVAKPEIGTVMTTDKFQSLNDRVKYECIVTETIHEMGHAFGLIPADRKENVEMSLGKHCTNTCVMRQGLSLPDDWIKFTNDRIEYGSLCERCEEDLYNFFR